METEAEPKKAPPKKSKLKAKSPELAEPSKPKILIFGKAGVGKTWGSLDFPGVYYIDTEGGANLPHYTQKLIASGGQYMGPEDGTQDSDVILEQFQALGTENHDFRTVVVDSLSQTWLKIIGEATEKFVSKHGDKSDYGAPKKSAVTFVRRLLNWVTRVDMSVIFIAHEKEVWGKEGEGKIGESFDAWEKLDYYLDLTLRIEKRGSTRYAVPKKSRLEGFPEGEAFVWNYEEFSKRYGKAVMETKARIIELASPEQIAEITRLTENVKISEEEIEKWFSKAKVENWDEMDKATIQKCIDYLKEKIK